MFFHVVHIRTGATCYQGTSESIAAEAWLPGCVYGRGETEHEATAEAMRRLAEQQKSIKN